MTDDVTTPEEIEEGAAPVVSEEAPPQREWSDEEEEQARLFGWKAPEEWAGGKGEGFINNPRDFMKRVEKMPFFNRMSEQIEAAKGDAESARREAAEHARRMDAIFKDRLKRDKEDYERRIADLNSQQRRAVEEADTATFDRLQKQREALQPPAQEPAQEAPQVDPAVKAYYDANEWAKNPILWNTAVQLVNANPQVAGSSAQQQLEYAEREIKRMYPSYFPTETAPKGGQSPVQRVDGGGLGAGIGRASAFSKLPAEAQAQFKRDAADGLFTNDDKGKQQFVEEYSRYA